MEAPSQALDLEERGSPVSQVRKQRLGEVISQMEHRAPKTATTGKSLLPLPGLSPVHLGPQHRLGDLSIGPLVGLAGPQSPLAPRQPGPSITAPHSGLQVQITHCNPLILPQGWGR